MANPIEKLDRYNLDVALNDYGERTDEYLISENNTEKIIAKLNELIEAHNKMKTQLDSLDKALILHKQGIIRIS